jgi:hypothetical protein
VVVAPSLYSMVSMVKHESLVGFHVTDKDFGGNPSPTTGSHIARCTVLSDVKGKGIEHTPGYLTQSDSLVASGMLSDNTSLSRFASINTIRFPA